MLHMLVVRYLRSGEKHLYYMGFVNSKQGLISCFLVVETKYMTTSIQLKTQTLTDSGENGTQGTDQNKFA